MGAASLLVLASLFPADSRDDAAWAEFKKFEGVWKFESVEMNEEKGFPPKDQWVIKKDGRADVMYFGVYLKTYIHKIDPSRKLKAIDQYTKTQDGKVTSEPVRGIYEINGDTWRICYNLTPGGKRPEAFTTLKGAKLVIWEMKREKK
jgi:uncharacterized protein (TIGR03067 family)